MFINIVTILMFIILTILIMIMKVMITVINIILIKKMSVHSFFLDRLRIVLKHRQMRIHNTQTKHTQTFSLKYTTYAYVLTDT